MCIFIPWIEALEQPLKLAHTDLVAGGKPLSPGPGKAVGLQTLVPHLEMQTHFTQMSS